MNKTSKALEALVEQFVAELKSEFEVNLENRDSFTFKIDIERRWNWDTKSRQTKIGYVLWMDYSTDKVEASTIMGAISEWLRRKGWNVLNKPKELILLEAPKSESEKPDDLDEVVF